ncbi:MAG TPA: hypothetical protein VG123_15480, partial [Streptosporangiaceae bacterium]|nr:hypothetical protein [Streptosporangiaceae bacterium]
MNGLALGVSTGGGQQYPQRQRQRRDPPVHTAPSLWLRDPSAAEVPAAEVPAAEVPAAEVPAAEVPAT